MALVKLRFPSLVLMKFGALPLVLMNVLILLAIAMNSDFWKLPFLMLPDILVGALTFLTLIVAVDPLFTCVVAIANTFKNCDMVNCEPLSDTVLGNFLFFS